jgi:hypothetical protein
MSDRDPKLEPFEALIGTWDTESKHRLVDETVRGDVSYEWLEGGHFVVVRSHNDHDMFPDAICVIGVPEHGDDLLMEYFDSRGVRRTYNVTLEDGVLRTWRDQANFDQRATAELGPDEFVMLTELAEQPGEWIEDMRTTYRRRGAG